MIIQDIILVLVVVIQETQGNGLREPGRAGLGQPTRRSPRLQCELDLEGDTGWGLEAVLVWFSLAHIP